MSNDYLTSNMNVLNITSYLRYFTHYNSLIDITYM